MQQRAGGHGGLSAWRLGCLGLGCLGGQAGAVGRGGIGASGQGLWAWVSGVPSVPVAWLPGGSGAWRPVAIGLGGLGTKDASVVPGGFGGAWGPRW